MYRDRWNPYDGGSSLAVYGTERFVAGSNLAPNVRFYDFRYPRPYSHTDAMPCSPSIPQPKVPFGRGRDAIPDSSSSCCTWHEQSRHDVWRPDATLHLGDAGYDRVHALAKASDLSDTLYCGMRGAVVEMRLRLAEDVGQDDMTRPAPPGWRAGAPRGKIALAETGVSLCREDEWVQENQGVPTLLHQQRQRPWQEEGEPEARQPGDSRLDSAYYAPE